MILKKQYFFLLLCFSITIFAKRIGSNNTASRQARAFFSKKEKDNIIMGFTACDDGITLDDSTATCSYNSYFPLVGDIVLNGGSLWLMRDLIFNSPLNLGVGKIGGNGFSIEFPRSVSNIDIPASNHQYVIELTNQINVGSMVNALSWSYDDNYLAAVTDGSGNPELHIVYVYDNIFTLTASYDLGTTNVHTVAWHPSSYYLVIGADGGNELQTFLFSPQDASLTMIDSANTGKVNAVAWHPTGNWIAVGKADDNELFVYAVSNGILGSAISYNMGNNSCKVEKNALDWHVSGTYLAVGYSKEFFNSELEIITFDGSVLVNNVSLNFDFFTNVNAVQWLPNCSLLSMGFNTGVERLQVYGHNFAGGTLTEKKSARIGELRTIYDLAWHPDGTFLATVKSKDSNAQEIEMYFLNQDDCSLHLVNGYEIDKDIRSIAWSCNGKYLATSTESHLVSLFKVVQRPLTFEYVDLFFTSDVTVHHEINIIDNCLINCRGNIFDLQTTSSLIVQPGATLTLEHMTIKGICGENIRCIDDTGKIILRNVVWVQEHDIQFKKGALQFKDSVKMEGSSVFAYQSKQTSTILSKSKLKLDAGFTFSYDPIFQASRNLIEFEDYNSILAMNGATFHVTTTGIQLLNGKIRVKRDSFFKAEVLGSLGINTGITFGNHDSSTDINVEILSGSALFIEQGILNYCNKNPNSFTMVNERSLLKMDTGTQLNMYESLYPGDGIITFNNATLARFNNTNILGSINTLGNFAQIMMSES